MVSVHSPASAEATYPDTSGYRAVRRSWAPSVSGDASGRSPKGAQHPVTCLARSSLGGPGMRIAVFGLGYVGTVTAAGLASRGHEVCGVDVDAFKVGRIAAGPQPGRRARASTSWSHEAVARGRLRATDRLRRGAATGADVSLICVGTPSAPHGGTDLRLHRAGARRPARRRWTSLAPPASGFHSVVVRSTVPPGHGRRGRRARTSPTLPDGWTRRHGDVPGVPARGLRRRRLLRPAVRGRRDRATTARSDRLSRAVRLPRPASSREVDVGTAEALKYACNAFHATKVSFANEMARVFRAYGVDAREVMRIFCEDTQAQHLPGLPAPGLRLRRLLPAQGPPRPAAPGAGQRRRRPAPARHDADQRDRACATSSTGCSPRTAGACACSASASRWTPTTCARARTSSWPSG